MKEWIPWVDRPDRDINNPPDPWTEWYEYYDPRPIPFPRKCKCCKTIVHNFSQSNEHRRECICGSTLRTYPPYLDSDRWERL